MEPLEGSFTAQADAFKRGIEERREVVILAAANQEQGKAQCNPNKGCKGHIVHDPAKNCSTIYIAFYKLGKAGTSYDGE